MPRLVISLLLTLALSAASFTAPAEWGDYYDFYDTASHPRRLLGNVEWKHLGPGIKRMNEGFVVRAEGDAKFILNYFPNHPRGLEFISQLSRKLNRPQLAQDHFLRALKLYPQHGETYAIYAKFLHQRQQYDQAIENYERAISLGYQTASVNYNLGLAYYETHRYELAHKYAHAAYQKGYPLPGLRNLLKKVDVWRPEYEPAESSPDSVGE